MDCGTVNLAVVFSPKFETPLIYDGGFVIHINKKFIKKISKLIKKISLDPTNEKLKQYLIKLRIKRENIINDYFNKIVNDLIKKCKEAKITELIIGYNIGWKQNLNMGRNTNRTFHFIPYRKLIHKLFTKGNENGIKVCENEESYTSKCDSLLLI